jgi:hypothetical protein
MGAEAPSGGQKTIVVGYDGTAPAEHALRRATEYARAFTAKVVVVSVAAPEPLAEVGARHRWKACDAVRIGSIGRATTFPRPTPSEAARVAARDG